MENIPPPSRRGFAKKWNKKQKDANMKTSAPFLDLGYQLAATFAVCILGGYFADRYFGTSPLLILVGVGLALLSATVSIYKVIAYLNYIEKNKKTEQKR